jgi:uncharacterized membrane protein YphA (DoxX/SURF4 family)
MQKVLKFLFTFFRLILGILFIFSGFVKGVDPLGSAYKFNEYFASVGITEMDQLSLIFSFMLSGAEFLIGVALLTGIFIRFTSWVTLIFISFFTILTFLLAVFNPVTDCGCFGDAIKLTNWQTFDKNIVFSIMVIFLFIQRKKIKYSIPIWKEIIAIIIAVIVFFGTSLYSYKHLPIIDFMPYNIGADIRAKMKMPVGAKQDVYATHMIYKNTKSGEVKEFTTNNYPWKDTLNWKWVNTKSVLVTKGYTPPIHDFSISDPQGNDITDSILNYNGYSFLLISYNLNQANKNGLIDAERLQQYCSTTGKAKFFAITASIKSDISKIKSENSLTMEFNSGDETALKTTIRSNPGIILLKHGIIIGKWAYRDFEKISLKSDDFFADNLNELRNKYEWALSIIILFGMGAILSLVFIKR